MILLLIIAAAMILFMYDGYKKGMVKIVLSLVATIVTVILAGFFTPTVAGVVKKTDAFISIENSVREKLDEKNVFNSGEEKKIIDKLDVPEQVKTYIEKYNTEDMYKKLGVDKFEDYVITMISNLSVTAIVFIVLYLIFFVAIKVIISALDIIAKLPIIKQFNKAGGIIVGAAQCIIVVWIFFIAISMFGNTEFATVVYEQINQNEIVTFLYDNNLIMQAIMKMIA